VIWKEASMPSFSPPSFVCDRLCFLLFTLLYFTLLKRGLCCFSSRMLEDVLPL